MSVIATIRIKACEEVTHEKQCELLHAIEGVNPTRLEFIADSVSQPKDCVNIDLSKLKKMRNSHLALSHKPRIVISVAMKLI